MRGREVSKMVCFLPTNCLPTSVGSCFINTFTGGFLLSSHFQRGLICSQRRTAYLSSRTYCRPRRILCTTSVRTEPEPVHVFLFITIVGWGKNSLLDQMLANKGIMQEVFRDGVPTILESDVIGANRFWGEVHDVSFGSLFRLSNVWRRTR
jgi:hypothetical protein